MTRNRCLRMIRTGALGTLLLLTLAAMLLGLRSYWVRHGWSYDHREYPGGNETASMLGLEFGSGWVWINHSASFIRATSNVNVGRTPTTVVKHLARPAQGLVESRSYQLSTDDLVLPGFRLHRTSTVYPRGAAWIHNTIVHVSVLWLILPAAAVLGGSLLRRRRHRETRPDRCPHCGYDLTGNTSGICPECGKPAMRTGEKRG